MGWDHWILLTINQDWRNSGLDWLLAWVSARETFAYPLLALLLVDATRREGGAGVGIWLGLGLVVGGTDILGGLLKDLGQAYRPCYDLASLAYLPEGPCTGTLTGLPSNHAANYTAAAMYLTLATRWREWRVGLWIIALLVGLSRVYLAKHYPSQVLAGVGLGAVTGLFGFAALSLLWPGLARLRTAPRATPFFSLLLESPPAVMQHELSPTPAGDPPDHALSIVIPIFNEQENVHPLVERVQQALADYPMPWELILVDDGSSDGTDQALRQATAAFGAHVRVLTLQRNFGQTAAMQAGIDAARGDVIATLDGDLQNDPKDIPRMAHRLLTEDLDLLVGWRKDRKDSLWLRKVPSRLANRLIGKITGVDIHDYGCSLKLYRAEVIKNVRLFGEMHRFIPAWMAVQTSPSRIREEVVTHHPRQFGESKYGITRTFRVLVDLLSVYFFMRFLSRPGHFFGRIGLAFGFVGGLALFWLFIAKFGFGQDIGDRPLFLTGILLVLMGVQFLTTGVLGELMARTYFATGQCPYVIRRDSAEKNGAAWRAPTR